MSQELRGLDHGSPPVRPFYYEAPVIIRGQFYADCSIGAHSYVNGGLIREFTDIGRFCSIAHGVAIGVGDHGLHLVSTHPFASQAAHDASHASPYRSDTTRPWNARTSIGHDVWVGMNVVVRAGCRVGVGAVLGAGAVVTTDVPPYAIFAGVPAKLVRYRFPEDVRLALLASEWWDYPLELLSQLPSNNIELFLEKLAGSGAARARYDWMTF